MSRIHLFTAAFLAALLLVALGRLTLRPRLRYLQRQLLRLSDLADREPLTGLLNRRGAEALAAKRLDQRLPTTVAMFDLDMFKCVNDIHGHHAGDRLLVLIGQRLESAARDAGGFAARLGGDEFVLVLPGEGLGTLVDAIALELQGPAEVGKEAVVIPRVSVGSAHTGTSVSSWESLLRHADRALYRAKARSHRAARQRMDAVASPLTYT
jgi:diguanylate cyclase (GGDEF)-like protein